MDDALFEGEELRGNPGVGYSFPSALCRNVPRTVVCDSLGNRATPPSPNAWPTSPQLNGVSRGFNYPSELEVNAVLHQQTKEGKRFIAARTKTLKPYERRYCSMKGELLALVYGLDKFAHVLACKKFTVMSNNLGVINVKMAKLGNNAVLSRWLDTLSKFDFDVLH